jgi:pimeloyl-ACP methyl ester carboxylesterase
MIKKLLKALLYLLVFLLILPYLIPTDYTTEAPEKPYNNSVFFTTQSGVKLHTQVYPAVGIEKGKILLIHGLMASTFSYRKNSAYLSENGYTVIAVDLPGFGYSDKPTTLEYTQANFAGFLWELLKDYDTSHETTTPWHLVGHSMGGSTALAMALQDKRNIADITMIDGAVTQKSNSMGWLMATPAGAWLKVALRYFMLNDKNFRKLLTDVYQKDVPQEAVDGYLAPVLTKGTINGLVRFVQTSKNITIEDVKGLDLKINLIWGGKDTWVPITTIDEIKAAVTLNQITIFPDAGHTPHETEPDFNEVLLGMLVK